MPHYHDTLPENCRSCGRSFGTEDRCPNHPEHCKDCCPAAVETGKYPSPDHGTKPPPGDPVDEPVDLEE